VVVRRVGAMEARGGEKAEAKGETKDEEWRRPTRQSHEEDVGGCVVTYWATRRVIG
jgi:hypothetical protein